MPEDKLKEWKRKMSQWQKISYWTGVAMKVGHTFENGYMLCSQRKEASTGYSMKYESTEKKNMVKLVRILQHYYKYHPE